MQSSDRGDSLRYKFESPPKSKISFNPKEAVKSFRVMGAGAKYWHGNQRHLEFVNNEEQSKVYICKWLSYKLIMSSGLRRPHEHVAAFAENKSEDVIVIYLDLFQILRKKRRTIIIIHFFK